MRPRERERDGETQTQSRPVKVYELKGYRSQGGRRFSLQKSVAASWLWVRLKACSTGGHPAGNGGVTLEPRNEVCNRT